MHVYVREKKKKHSKDLRHFFSLSLPPKQFKLSTQKFIILKAAADQISCDPRVKRSHVLSFIKQNTKLASGCRIAAQKINSLPQKTKKKKGRGEEVMKCALRDNVI